VEGRPFERVGSGFVLALALLAARASAQQGEPAQARSPFAAALAQKMRAHPYLARTAFEPVESHPPYLVFVQRSTESTARPAGEVAAAAVALLDPVRERFEKEVATPLRLERRAAALAVIVLGSRDAFDECYRATSGAWHFDAPSPTHALRATFARDVGAAVLYDEPGEARDPLERARSAQHAFVHALQCAYHPENEAAPLRCWLFEGMADFLARPERADAFPAPERLSDFVRDAKAPDTRWAHLRTLAEMCTVDEPLHLEEFFQERTPDPSLMPGPDQDPWTAFYRQATLLYAFLATRDGEHRAGLAKWIGRAFAGSRGADAFAASFAPRKVEELERSFLGWIQDEHERAFPSEKVKPELLLGCLSRADLGALAAAEPAPSAAPAPASGTARSAPAPRAPAGSTRALAPLSIADATPDERLAWAITEIGAGRLRAGRTRLNELRQGADAALVERIEREDRRAAAWEAARDAFLARVVGDESEIELDLGPRVTATEFGVRAYSEGLVELDDKKGGIRRVPVESLDPLALARAMRTGPSESEWQRFYLFVLRGDERWKKLLKPEGAEAAALLADARSDYPGRLQLGEAMAKIAALADRPPPSTPKEADQRAQAFKHLLTELSGTSIVARKRAQLRAHAQAVFERRFDLTGPSSVLAGRLETLGAERVRITYAFDDPKELADFSTDLYPKIASRSLGTTQAKDVPFQVSRGALIALGQATLRTLYDLEAPLSVRYDVEFEKAEAERMAFYLAAGIADDGAEHFVWAVNLDSLQMLDHSGWATSAVNESEFVLGQAYPLELRHDGREARLLCNGKEQARLGVEARQWGALFLRANTDLSLAIQKLVIEGRLRPESFDRMKRAWAERQMAGL
jgi:hypothetical protein